jgi:DcaP outer membrane protein
VVGRYDIPQKRKRYGGGWRGATGRRAIGRSPQRPVRKGSDEEREPMASMTSTRCRRIIVVALIALAAERHAFAQQAAAAAAGQTQPDVAALSRLVDEQRKLLVAQGRVIEDLTRRLDETNKAVGASQQRLADLERQAQAGAPQVQERLKEIEQSIRVLPELTPKDFAQSTEFPGSVPIPGTKGAIKFGGQIRTLLVRNLGALGTEDRFVTSSIPIEGTAEADKDSRTTLTANPSRFEIDFRTPTNARSLRAFLSGDFAGSNRTYRLRHAFGQWRGLLIGQTWSAFSDPEAEPDGLDFEGLNAISLFRQPGIRWTHPLSVRYELSLAAENPSPDITGASGVNQVPDLIARVRFNTGEEPTGRRLMFRGGGHTQAAFLIRQIRGEPDGSPNEIVSTAGYGIHVSGKLPARWRRQDYIKFATAAGRGIGRYITDLGTLGGQDAVYDAARNMLIGLPVYSTYVGYEHAWTEGLRSTGTFGLVFVDNLDIQPADALRETTRTSFNLSWSPIDRIDLIAEFLSGRRVNKDRQDGRAGQLQFGWIFRF